MMTSCIYHGPKPCAMLYFRVNNNTNKYASYPDWHRSPRSPSSQIVYNTGRHRASGGVLLTPLRFAPVQQVCRTGLTTVERVMNFSIFGLGANPWAKFHQKGRWPAGLLDLPSYQISSPSVNPSRRYPLQKILRTHKQTNKQTNKQTVNNISPACLLACGDDKSAQSNLGRGLQRCKSLPRGGFIMTAKVVAGEFIMQHQLLSTLWAKPEHIAKVKARRSPVLKTDVAATAAA